MAMWESSKELKKVQEEEDQSGKNLQLAQQSKEPQPAPMQQKQPPVQPPPTQPSSQPKQQSAHDPLAQGISKCQLQKDSRRPAPQLGSENTQQAGGQSHCMNNTFHGQVKSFAGSDFMNPCQSSPTQNTKYSRLTSTNYIQQW
ncbi:nuclear polyadenylated RNA-binding protein NAB2-like isoform X2 [Tupaia chinensis]|uniref:nuclear polyadenylated RNA-binding protein NAB2-like isoform X2 n=1 Tax=Tupaia chinensis TaxID=246437 RepID=UPI0007043886|nr:nuclear polyadenylated RNA-binding protein NAB2-like isoform X2 [Tupaia chinensis]